MNLPNKLTLGRLVLTALFVVALSAPIPHGRSIALLLFIVAAITDYFDGKIARERNLVTNFGKLMDPLADKVLIAAALILLVDLELLWAWSVVVVVFREFLVTGLRLIAANEGIVVAAEKLGKWKTTIQMITVIYLLCFVASEEPAFSWLAGLFTIPGAGYQVVGRVCEIAMVVLTLWSGVSYVYKNRRLLADS